MSQLPHPGPLPASARLRPRSDPDLRCLQAARRRGFGGQNEYIRGMVEPHIDDMAQRLTETRQGLAEAAVEIGRQLATGRSLTEALSDLAEQISHAHKTIAEGMYEYYALHVDDLEKIQGENHANWVSVRDHAVETRQLVEGMEQTLADLTEQLGGIEERLNADRERREREEADREYFSLHNDHLVGNRIRWGGRLLNYWWNTRIRHA